LPGQLTAQASEACGGAEKLLMYCTFNGGAKQVGVCLGDDTVSYQFGPNFSAPELTLTSRIADLDDAPYGWASNKIYDSVTLRNGDTTYAVYMETWRGTDPVPASGGIVVTNSDQSQITLECDHRSVIPTDPLQGIGKLTAITNGLDRDALSRCLLSVIDETSTEACIGTFRDAEIADGTCGADSSTNMTDCWGGEAARWHELVDEAFQSTLRRLDHTPYGSSTSLATSQTSWLMSQQLDCELEGRYPFSPDAGVAQCRAENAAARLSFFADVLGYAEFDG